MTRANYTYYYRQDLIIITPSKKEIVLYSNSVKTLELRLINVATLLGDLSTKELSSTKEEESNDN